MGSQKVAQLVERRLMQPRQRDMRREFAGLWRKPRANQRLLDLVTQCHELSRTLNAHPEAMRLVRPAKTAGSGELQGKSTRAQPCQRVVDIGRDCLTGLADEPQSQMKVSGVHPPRPGDPGAQQRQLQLELRRKADPDKQTQ